MPALQVREFPQELYEQLKLCAESEHRSIAQQTIVSVEEMIRNRANANSYGSGSSTSSEQPRMVASPRYCDFSTNEERSARIRKREKIFAEIRRMSEEHPNPEPSVEEIVQTIREQREERTNRILEAAGFDLPKTSQKAGE